MAELGEEEVADKCPICLENPSPISCFLVPCGHTFCRKCCKQLFQESEMQQITCPLCRQLSTGFTRKKILKKKENPIIDAVVFISFLGCMLLTIVFLTFHSNRNEQNSSIEMSTSSTTTTTTTTTTLSPHLPPLRGKL
jgi:hypothetical protein